MGTVQCINCGSTDGSHDLMCINAPFNAGVDLGKITPPSDYEKGRPVVLRSGMPIAKIPEQPSKEVRTVSSTGGEKGVKPQAHSYLPRAALDLISEVYSFGAQKYAAHNWRRGYEWSKSYDALQRHLTAFWDREENDPESGLSHLGHAGFHIFALIVFSSNRAKYGEFDDRYKEN